MMKFSLTSIFHFSNSNHNKDKSKYKNVNVKNNQKKSLKKSASSYFTNSQEKQKCLNNDKSVHKSTSMIDSFRKNSSIKRSFSKSFKNKSSKKIPELNLKPRNLNLYGEVIQANSDSYSDFSFNNNESLTFDYFDFDDDTDKYNALDSSYTTNGFENSLFTNNFIDNSFNTQLSVNSDKENISPLNRSIINAPYLSPSPKFDLNPFMLSNNDILYKKFLRYSHNYGLSPQESLKKTLEDDEQRNFAKSFHLLDPPCFQKPLRPLPEAINIKDDLKDTSKIYPYQHQLLHFNNDNIDDLDLDETSLFDALSSVEWWDCSRVTLVSYNS